MPTYHALLFDIGEVVSAAPWPALDELERVTGRSFAHRGPNDPDNDPIWQRYLAGELSYSGYWIEVATAAGYTDWKDFYRDVGALPPERFTDPDAAALIADAHEAGLLIGALTNDGASINGMGFFDSVPEMAVFDVIVDAAEFGERKPAPEPYLRAARALGVEPNEIVFLDDTAACVWGADEVGMTGILVDAVDRKPAFDLARELLGIIPASDAQLLVREVEDVYREQDMEGIMRLFDPDIVIVWNGERVATGLAETRRFHDDVLGFGVGLADLELTKRLRSATDDTVSVEFRAAYTSGDGTRSELVAAEIWTLHRGKLIEWRCYEHSR